MSILKSTNSGKEGIIRFHIKSEKYDHTDGKINYYYVTHKYGLQPPFYIYEREKYGFFANVYNQKGEEISIRINSIQELETVEKFWDMLIDSHNSIVELTTNPINTEQLKYVAGLIEKIGEKNKIVIEVRGPKRRFIRR